MRIGCLSVKESHNRLTFKKGGCYETKRGYDFCLFIRVVSLFHVRAGSGH
jgi:hypothetical protein